jgi:SAM-dependent methyltransferase
VNEEGAKVMVNAIHKTERPEMIEWVQQQSLLKCRQIETLPQFKGGGFEEVRQQRYPVERGLPEYEDKLPDLQPVLGELNPAGRVLDIGAGFGFALSEIRNGHGFSVVGTGIADNKPCCPFIEAVGSHLPVAADTFELVLSVHGISWEPDQKKAIEEVLRVLKPGGVGLIFLITFSNSIFIWHGESFWEEIGVEVADYRRYEFRMEDYLEREGFTIKVVDRAKDVPDEYRYAYYLIIRKQ